MLRCRHQPVQGRCAVLCQWHQLRWCDLQVLTSCGFHLCYLTELSSPVDEVRHMLGQLLINMFCTPQDSMCALPLWSHSMLPNTSYVS